MCLTVVILIYSHRTNNWYDIKCENASKYNFIVENNVFSSHTLLKQNCIRTWVYEITFLIIVVYTNVEVVLVQ